MEWKKRKKRRERESLHTLSITAARSLRSPGSCFCGSFSSFWLGRCQEASRLHSTSTWLRNESKERGRLRKRGGQPNPCLFRRLSVSPGCLRVCERKWATRHARQVGVLPVFRTEQDGGVFSIWSAIWFFSQASRISVVIAFGWEWLSFWKVSGKKILTWSSVPIFRLWEHTRTAVVSLQKCRFED